MMLRYLLKGMLLPPLLQLLMLLAAFLMWRWKPRLARWLAALGFISLWLLATPFVTNALLYPLETRHLPLKPENLAKTDAEAIVVLAAGVLTNANEYGRPMAGLHTLMRLRYGAYLHHQTELPILVSGGNVFDHHEATLADVMAHELQTLYQVPVEFRERRSRTTAENARFSAEMLKAAGINKVMLVTEAFHMPRSVYAFEQAGLEVVPAPTMYYAIPDESTLGIIPSALALNGSSLALHEYMGLVVYRLLN